MRRANQRRSVQQGRPGSRTDAAHAEAQEAGKDNWNYILRNGSRGARAGIPMRNLGTGTSAGMRTMNSCIGGMSAGMRAKNAWSGETSAGIRMKRDAGRSLRAEVLLLRTELPVKE